jgi:glucose/arabinose dehydrogenase
MEVVMAGTLSGRRLRRIVVATLLLGAASVPATFLPADAAVVIAAKKVAGGLNEPVAFTFSPNGHLWYVEKSTGEIRVRNLDTDGDRLFYDVAGVNGEGERGMLGIALHPAFPAKPFVYVYVTRTVKGRLRNQIIRLKDVNGNGTSLRMIFTSPASSSPYHNGGRILFGPDGMLYAIVGDGHDSANSQDLSGNVRGKILRMTPTGSIPDDNPLTGGKRRLLFAYGIRNSFGFDFDPQTGSLWETENGPACNDELNLVIAGANYAWGPHETCSGASPANTNQDGPDRHLPILYFQTTIGITGAAFCDGCGLGTASEGDLFVGAVKDGDVRRVDLNTARTGVDSFRVVHTNPSGSTISYEVGPGGTIYFSDFSAVFKLVSRSA